MEVTTCQTPVVDKSIFLCYDESMNNHSEPIALAELHEREATAPTIETIKSILPFYSGSVTDENKARFLSYRACGFAMRESCALADLHEATIKRWRDPTVHYFDAEFVAVEKALIGPHRQRMRAEILDLHFTRNMRLLLQYDEEIITKTLGLQRDDEGEVIYPSKQELNYLTRMRGQYTAQQLEVLRKIIDPGQESSFDLSDILNEIQEDRGRDESEVTTTVRVAEIQHERRPDHGGSKYRGSHGKFVKGPDDNG